MPDHPLWLHIGTELENRLGHQVKLQGKRPVSGGSINQAWQLQTSAGAFFVKLNNARHGDMFAAEAEGLRELAASQTLQVPEALIHGVYEGRSREDQAWIVLRHIEFGPTTPKSSAQLGEQLAALHQCRQTRFGWTRDNTIGTTPQLNRWQADWPVFWREQRLGHLLQLIEARHGGSRLIESGQRLCDDLGALFNTSSPVPSLLHGDLWGGNHGTDRKGRPVIFDPAVYYGDRETDIAMTELFGGFSQEFYAAYKANWPLDSGYAVRKTLYNLYHILNHYLMFGGGYGAQAESMTARLLAELT